MAKIIVVEKSGKEVDISGITMELKKDIINQIVEFGSYGSKQADDKVKEIQTKTIELFKDFIARNASMEAVNAMLNDSYAEVSQSKAVSGKEIIKSKGFWSNYYGDFLEMDVLGEVFGADNPRNKPTPDFAGLKDIFGGREYEVKGTREGDTDLLAVGGVTVRWEKGDKDFDKETLRVYIGLYKMLHKMKHFFYVLINEINAHLFLGQIQFKEIIILSDLILKYLIKNIRDQTIIKTTPQGSPKEDKNNPGRVQQTWKVLYDIKNYTIDDIGKMYYVKADILRAIKQDHSLRKLFFANFNEKQLHALKK